MADAASWREGIQVNNTDSWVWTVDLEALRLGELESHERLALNWARRKSWAGSLRPEARTTTRHGRVLVAAEYHLEVLDLLALLVQKYKC